MDDIKSNLNGDSKHDIKFLMEAAEKNKDSEYAQEIARECGRLIFSLLPEDMLSEFSTAIEQDVMYNDEPLQAWLELSSNNENEAALKTIEPFALKLFKAQEEGMFAEDKVSKYFNYDTMLEYVLIREHIKTEKEIRDATVRFSSAYAAYASSLFDAGRFEESITWNKRAIQWKPVCFYYYTELAENYKQLKDITKAENWTDAAFKYVISPSEMAKWLRTKAFISIERKKYELAAAELIVSLGLEQSEYAINELIYLKSECNYDVDSITMEDAIKFLVKNEIPFRASDENLAILDALLPVAEENGDELVASICAQSLYVFTLDDELLEKYGKYIHVEEDEDHE